ARLAQLVNRARRRVGQPKELEPIAGELRPAIEAVLEGRAGARESLDRAFAATLAWCERTLPTAVAATVSHVLAAIGSLPVERPSARPPISNEAPLPEWVPSKRTMGGFHLIRPLGSGSTASVFVVCRSDERDDKDRQRFALKVPQFDAVA